MNAAAAVIDRNNVGYKYSVGACVAGFAIGYIRNLDPFLSAKITMISITILFGLLKFLDFYPNCRKSPMLICASLISTASLYYLTYTDILESDISLLLRKVIHTVILTGIFFYAFISFQRAKN